jgi:hypothetical protein
MKNLLIIAGLFAVVSVGCAAPPYVPQPPPPVTNYVTLAWTQSADAVATRIYQQYADTNAYQWQLVGTYSNGIAPGILTNYPTHWAFQAVDVNANGVESTNMNPQYTNIIQQPFPIPAAPTGLTAK